MNENRNQNNRPANAANTTQTAANQLPQLPKDYVGEAERVIISIGGQSNQNGRYRFSLSVSQLRNIIGMVMDIYNDVRLEEGKKLSENAQERLQILRLRIIYNAGRENAVRGFLNKAKLMDYLTSIGDSKEKFVKFTHYMEALVAYHKFYTDEK